MSNEQNLDEMLRSLQESVDNLDDGENIEKLSVDYSNLSTQDLQKRLEKEFFANNLTGNHESDHSYDLDSDFLAEFSNEEDELTEDVFESISVEKAKIDEIEEMAEISEVEESEEVIEFETIEELEEDNATYDIAEKDDLAELSDLAEMCESEESDLPWEEAETAHEAVIGEIVVEPEDLVDDPFDALDDIDVVDTYEDVDVLDLQSDVKESVELKEKSEEIIVESSKNDVDSSIEKSFEFNAYAPVQPEKPKSFKALIMDYGRPDPIPSVEETRKEIVEEVEEETPDIGDILSDFADDTPTEGDIIKSEVQELMTSLGCEDELSCIDPEVISEIYGQFEKEAEPQNELSGEVSSEEKTESQRNTYKKFVFISALKLVACAIMTFAAFIYDTLPMFEVEFVGLFDYDTYPGAYMMLGAQMIIICAVILWRPLWNGIKRLFTVYPNIYSMAAVVVCSCVVYDSVFFLTGSYLPLETPTFHFVSCAFLSFVALYEMLMRIRESKTYDLYSTDVAKFTFASDRSKDSVADKMYSGGFSKDRKVFSPSAVTCPDGFFNAIREDGSFKNRIYNALVLMSAGVGVLFGIIIMIVHGSLEQGVIAALSAVLVSLPVMATAAIAIPLFLSSVILKKRGIALTGRGMIRRYGGDNALVFNDLHLFKKCDPKQVGFVCYEDNRTQMVVSALNILYSRIGGPMGEVFASIPEQYKSKSIRVRRITRSGIEAVVDKSHTLVVGDREFLRRYGIEFPQATERPANKNATLYVSLDGRASAKITAIYRIEPLFDMLVERLSEEGVHCVIETYDPMINTSFISKNRKSGRTPISVVHKNATNINGGVSVSKHSDHGILVLSSRLKLAEAVVWCSRLSKIERISDLIVYSSVVLGTLAVMLLAIFAIIPFFAQYLILTYSLLIAAAIFVLSTVLIPPRDHFIPEVMPEASSEAKNNKN